MNVHVHKNKCNFYSAHEFVIFDTRWSFNDWNAFGILMLVQCSIFILDFMMIDSLEIDMDFVQLILIFATVLDLWTERDMLT